MINLKLSVSIEKFNLKILTGAKYLQFSVLTDVEPSRLESLIFSDLSLDFGDSKKFKLN